MTDRIQSAQSAAIALSESPRPSFAGARAAVSSSTVRRTRSSGAPGDSTTHSTTPSASDTTATTVPSRPFRQIRSPELIVTVHLRGTEHCGSRRPGAERDFYSPLRLGQSCVQPQARSYGRYGTSGRHPLPSSCTVSVAWKARPPSAVRAGSWRSANCAARPARAHSPGPLLTGQLARIQKRALTSACRVRHPRISRARTED
jgi:hypothetical protein